MLNEYFDIYCLKILDKYNTHKDYVSIINTIMVKSEKYELLKFLVPKSTDKDFVDAIKVAAKHCNYNHVKYLVPKSTNTDFNDIIKSLSSNSICLNIIKFIESYNTNKNYTPFIGRGNSFYSHLNINLKVIQFLIPKDKCDRYYLGKIHELLDNYNYTNKELKQTLLMLDEYNSLRNYTQPISLMYSPGEYSIIEQLVQRSFDIETIATFIKHNIGDNDYNNIIKLALKGKYISTIKIIDMFLLANISGNYDELVYLVIIHKLDLQYIERINQINTSKNYNKSIELLAEKGYIEQLKFLCSISSDKNFSEICKNKNITDDIKEIINSYNSCKNDCIELIHLYAVLSPDLDMLKQLEPLNDNKQYQDIIDKIRAPDIIEFLQNAMN